MVDVERLIADALALQGAPFHISGRTPAGIDCVGIIVVPLNAQGIEVVNDQQSYSMSAAPALLVPCIEASGLVRKRDAGESMQRGDVLTFALRGEVQHVGLYLGDDRMLHATQRAGVRAVTLSPIWRDRIAGVYAWK